MQISGRKAALAVWRHFTAALSCNSTEVHPGPASCCDCVSTVYLQFFFLVLNVTGCLQAWGRNVGVSFYVGSCMVRCLCRVIYRCAVVNRCYSPAVIPTSV